ncbi:MAG: hypothetical protein K5821_17110 [Nitrobacter sp.]|uniref:hypothetical protein n=1 Tax=Nitrobacter sp. TaxID=29420 RepID=UPI00262F9A52|nr:hypothetical protein [Nitrobacter sp.]MCV0388065.1 hypothetical protein [Nitrobacter sp.]
MLNLLLILAASLNPSFSFSHEDRGKYDADVFLVPSGEDKTTILEKLIEEERKFMERTTSDFQPERGSNISFTALRNEAGIVTTAYLYSAVPKEEDTSYLCRLEMDPKSRSGLARTLLWCLSFIEPTFRPTLEMPTSKP